MYQAGKPISFPCLTWYVKFGLNIIHLLSLRNDLVSQIGAIILSESCALKSDWQMDILPLQELMQAQTRGEEHIIHRLMQNVQFIIYV